MKFNIKLKEHEEDIHAFQFSQYNQKGICFLRLSLLEENSINILVSQLIGYSGCSITNAAEDIFENIVEYLINEKIVSVSHPVIPAFCISRDKKYDVVANHLINKVNLIHYYPPELALNPDYPYAILKFGDQIGWNYRNKEQIEYIIKNKKFVNVDSSLLQNWKEGG